HFTSILRQGIPIRRLGSAAIDLAYLAAGRFDGYFEVGLFPWDVAAGKLLVEEAGGKVTQWDENDIEIDVYSPILATNQRIHGELAKLLKRDV
ncbi:MAG TPA: inositol monophosphatase family protein, partial [Chlamydiales bacterium]|nr:inositol monophosphatase family protein [Chlamydiales bacterium]